MQNSSSSESGPWVATVLIVVFLLLQLFIYISHSNQELAESKYEQGYSAGFVDGEESGYLTGFNEGYDSGLWDGFSMGYDDGYDDGSFGNYDDGYDNGYADAIAGKPYNN